MGRIIGVVLGAAAMGLFGAVLGYFIGGWIDRGLSGIDARPPQRDQATIQQVFLDTVLRLMGHLAKADGRISEAEVAQTEHLMAQLGLRGERRSAAIALFKEGSAPDFSLDEAMDRFLSACGRYRQLKLLLLEFLFHIAFADDTLEPQERAILLSVARRLNISAAVLDRLLQMYRAQYAFAEDHKVERSEQQLLADAYAALGIGAQASDREVRSAYRKLMSKHHPDKLIAQGVPEEMLKVATEKAQEITAAHELIMQHRRG